MVEKLQVAEVLQEGGTAFLARRDLQVGMVEEMACRLEEGRACWVG